MIPGNYRGDGHPCGHVSAPSRSIAGDHGRRLGVSWPDADRSIPKYRRGGEKLKKQPDTIDPITGSVHIWNQTESLALMRGEAQPSVPGRVAIIVEQFRKRGQLPSDFTAERLLDTSLY